MAPRRGRRRPWFRTRAFRLARTVVLAYVLVAGVVWWCQDDGRPADAAVAGAAGSGLAGAGDAKASPAPARSREAGRTPAPRRTASAPPSPPAGRAAPRPPAPRAPSATPRPARPSPSPPAPRTLPRSPAATLSIPYLGLKAPVMGLKLNRNRELATPPLDRPELVGWYEDGPSPGEPGTAVVVGHLDTKRGPAVFAGLGSLTPGRLIEARRADGRTAVYTVDAVETYEKDAFPNTKVYGPRNRPELRLITCGGSYDHKTGYDSNTVVFAHLTRTV
ncbi:class F sortase [Streptomyces minutiscleroticus]|uniref:Class F sortase n=1 Tax=Streptomyces minutiscleroticus TaxID=68238 RepID=A0A918NR79_9ACTN|nr:class F sortase [Streptomyces minutiscleroticus]GGX88225.1 hypothetical protein GCM10010358_47880 [Streptomyces minutiscleroticus]